MEGTLGAVDHRDVRAEWWNGGPNGKSRPRSWPGFGLACQGELILFGGIATADRRSRFFPIDRGVSLATCGCPSRIRVGVYPHGERSLSGRRNGDSSPVDP